MKSYLKDIVQLFFPKVCPGCGKGLLNNEHLVCSNCILSMVKTPFDFGPDNPVSKIFEGRLNLENAGALFYYSRDTKLQNMVHEIKYNNRKDLGRWLGEQMGLALSKSETGKEIDLMVPVPLSASRQKERGYNQSRLLAEGINSVMPIPVEKKIISRRNKSESQTHKNRAERWENVKRDFVLEDTSLSDRHILMIDDVITTGATLEACASVLTSLKNCKISIYSLCLAS